MDEAQNKSLQLVPKS